MMHDRQSPRRRLLLSGAALPAALAMSGCGVDLPIPPGIPGLPRRRRRRGSAGTRCLDGSEQVREEYEKTVPDDMNVEVDPIPADPDIRFLRRGLALSPDGSLITAHRTDQQALTETSGGLVVWSTADGTIAHELEERAGGPVDWLADGEHLVVGHPRYASVLSLDGEVLTHLLGHDLLDDLASMSAVSVSPDGSRLATLGNDDTVRLFTVDADTCGGDGTLQLGQDDDPSAVLWSADGSRLLIGAAGSSYEGAPDNAPQWWDADSGERIGPVEGTTGRVFSIALLEDDTVLALAEDPSAVQVIRPDGTVDTGPELTSGWFGDLVAGPDGKVVVTDRADTLLLWDSVRDEVEELPREETTQWCFSPDGDTLYGLSQAQGVMAWDGSGWTVFEIP